jgi:hypothetical protein
MHGGATPRGPRHGAFVHGEHTIESIAERRKAVALNEMATELLFEAFRAKTDADRKLRGGLLRPDDAESQRKVTRAQIATAVAMRERTTELHDAWARRLLMAKSRRRVKQEPPAGPPQDD